MERHFLIVAADGQVRQTLAGDLREKGFSVTLAANGTEAERVVQNVEVRSVLVETHLPDTSARELSERLREIRPDCHVTIVTSFELIRNSPEMLRHGRNDFLLSRNEVFDMLHADDEPAGLAGGDWPWEERGVPCLTQVIDVLVGLLEIEYELFSSSSHQTMQLARATAEELSAGEDMVNEVVLGSLLRDVGRAATEDDRSENGNGDTDPENQSAEHVLATQRLFEHIDFPWKVVPVIRHHHEFYNGTGFPDRLRGREIPMAARIVAVVDAYTEMTSGKDREAVEPEQALQELVRRAGHRFDPEVVEAFHRVVDKRFSHRLSKKRAGVLLVEPDKQFRRLLKMGLTNEGLKVRELAQTDQAMEQLLKKPPTLILVDVDADAAAAFQLLSEMRGDETLCRMPIAFLSGQSNRELRLRALREGVDEFLRKSDDIVELVARVENILLREAIRADGEVRRNRRGISGNLENLTLPEIIQTLTIGMKTACVSLVTEQGTGKIWFENGTARHAEIDGMQGDEAFFAMVGWKDGEFVIEHNVRTESASLTQDGMFLLMEGLRLIDEETQETAAS